MYHQHHREKSIQSSTKIPTFPERHMFPNGMGDSGLILSTDAKPRLKWTQELHERFKETVDQLGGAEKATPKSVLKLMGIPGLTLYHLKSHLQKYRLSKNVHGQANSGCNKAATGDRVPGGNVTHTTNQNLSTQSTKSMHIGEAIQMQIEVQRQLHEQIEVQRHLQLRIEAQGKYLQSVLEKAQESLGGQISGTTGPKSAKIQLSGLASQVPTLCANSAFSGIEELADLCLQQKQTAQPTNCSLYTCLTSHEGSLRHQELYNNQMDLKPINFGASTEPWRNDNANRPQQTQPMWQEDMKEGRVLFPTGNETNSSNLSMSIGLQSNAGNWNGEKNHPEERFKGFEADPKFLNQGTGSSSSIKLEEEKESSKLKVSFPAKLDLNIDDENNAALSSKLDLNGFV